MNRRPLAVAATTAAARSFRLPAAASLPDKGRPGLCLDLSCPWACCFRADLPVAYRLTSAVDRARFPPPAEAAAVASVAQVPPRAAFASLALFWLAVALHRRHLRLVHAEAAAAVAPIPGGGGGGGSICGDASPGAFPSPLPFVGFAAASSPSALPPRPEERAAA